MLRNTKDLEHDVISATDGEIGHVKDFYFDDDAWAIRYIVADTGGWLANREVLISPISVAHPNWSDGMLSVAITKDQVRNSPSIDTDKPVSRQNEVEYMGHFGYPYYWIGGGIWGGGFYPYAMAPGYAGDRSDRKEREHEQARVLRAERKRHRNDDPHLRSCKSVTGYHIHATDGEIGHVSGYLIDDETWAIRYVVVDTNNWWLGHQVLMAPEWITGVQWLDVGRVESRLGEGCPFIRSGHGMGLGTGRQPVQSLRSARPSSSRPRTRKPGARSPVARR